jgi:uncharacterized protein (TIGR03435 family)
MKRGKTTGSRDARGRLLGNVSIVVLIAKVGIGIVGAPEVHAQAPTSVNVEFEVASVRPATAESDGPRLVMNGGPGTSDPGLITYLRIPMRRLLSVAYGVSVDQIFGPDWIGMERYDIRAKVPAGATREQVNLMLQHLLAERFTLRIHRDTKSIQGYDVVIAKNGPRLKEAVNAPASATPAEMQQQRSQAELTKLDRNGFPIVPAGVHAMLAFPHDGLSYVTFRKYSIADLVQYLGVLLGSVGSNSILPAPVEDKTGLTDKYDFTLDFDGPAFAPIAATLAAGADGPDSPGPSLFTALETQLGLKLEQKKVSVDILLIDHVERVPTEN